MYVVPPTAPQIAARVTSSTGESWTYPNLAAALKALIKSNLTIFASSHSRQRAHVRLWIENGTFRLTDIWGQVLDYERIKTTFDEMGPAPSWIWRKAPTYAFRDGPVPYTSSRRGGHGYRYPRTLQELRETGRYLEDLDEAEMNASKVGRIRALPTAWDDQTRCRDKSWKSQRKNQWRGNKGASKDAP